MVEVTRESCEAAQVGAAFLLAKTENWNLSFTSSSAFQWKYNIYKGFFSVFFRLFFPGILTRIVAQFYSFCVVASFWFPCPTVVCLFCFVCVGFLWHSSWVCGQRGSSELMAKSIDNYDHGQWSDSLGFSSQRAMANLFLSCFTTIADSLLLLLLLLACLWNEMVNNC